MTKKPVPKKAVPNKTVPKKPVTVFESESEEQTPRIDVSKLRRKKQEPTEDVDTERVIPVSAGPVEKAMELAFNPSDEMLPSVTVIDKFQGRLFPLIDLINIMWDDVLQVAHYRQDKDEYRRVFKRTKPISANWLWELLHSTAKWQKSIGGTNLTKITDIALAETESRAGDEGDGIGGVDAWGRE